MQSSQNAECVASQSTNYLEREEYDKFSCTLNVLLDSLFPMHSLDKCVVELFVAEKKTKTKQNKEKGWHSLFFHQHF